MSWDAILPAAILTLGILAVLIVDVVTRGRRPATTTTIALGALGAAAVSALFVQTGSEPVLGVLRVDAFAIALTVFCCATGFLSVVATTRGEAFRRPGGEFLTLVMASVVGMAFLSMSIDLVVLYLAFETVSIPSYVLVGMRRGDLRANEASMKYVLFGAVSSGMMLYGLSFLVGLSGGTSLQALTVAIENGAAAEPAFFVAALLVLAGFAFKISAVPFHFWAPDVYAGAPAAVAGFLAVASKAAGFAALVRVVAATVPEVPEAASALGTVIPDANVLVAGIAVVAVLSMTVGNLAALRQKEIKRLLAWSSIAHAGYILLALSVWSEAGLAALMIYLVAYLFMNLAAFFIAGIAIRDLGTGEIGAFRGLLRHNPWLTVAFAIVLFSLTGLPPFFGFVAKLQIFYAVFDKGYVWLGLIGLVNGVISLYYYAYLISLMVFEETPEGQPAPRVALGWVDRAFCAVTVVPLLVFGLFWDAIASWAAGVVPGLVGGAS